MIYICFFKSLQFFPYGSLHRFQDLILWKKFRSFQWRIQIFKRTSFAPTRVDFSLKWLFRFLEKSIFKYQQLWNGHWYYLCAILAHQNTPSSCQKSKKSQGRVTIRQKVSFRKIDFLKWLPSSHFSTWRFKIFSADAPWAPLSIQKIKFLTGQLLWILESKN